MCETSTRKVFLEMVFFLSLEFLSVFSTQTAKYRKSLLFIGVYIGKSVSPLKYPLKQDARNDRGAHAGFISVSQISFPIASDAINACTRVSRESRVRLSDLARVYHVSLRRHPGNLPVRFAFRFLGYQFPASARHRSLACRLSRGPGDTVWPNYSLVSINVSSTCRPCASEFACSHVFHISTFIPPRELILGYVKRKLRKNPDISIRIYNIPVIYLS